MEWTLVMKTIIKNGQTYFDQWSEQKNIKDRKNKPKEDNDIDLIFL